MTCCDKCRKLRALVQDALTAMQCHAASDDTRNALQARADALAGCGEADAPQVRAISAWCGHVSRDVHDDDHCMHPDTRTPQGLSVYCDESTCPILRHIGKECTP